MKLSSSISISPIDVIVLAFAFTVWLSSICTGSSLNNYYLLPLVFCYFAFRVLNKTIKSSSEIIVLLVALYCIYECCLGYYQLFKMLFDKNSSSLLCGTFLNSGPYGCALSLCCSLLLPYKYKGNNSVIKTIATICLYAAIVLLPATLCRTAWISLSISMFLFAYSNFNKLKTIINKYWYIFLVLFILIIVGLFNFKPTSANARMFINKVSVQIIRSNSLWGVGPNNYAGAYGEVQHDYFKENLSNQSIGNNNSSIEKERMTVDCPDNAFNDYLQIGAESGLFAMVLFVALLIVSIVLSIRNGYIWHYGLITFSIVALFYYPLDLIQIIILLSSLLAMCSKETGKGFLFQLVVFITLSFFMTHYFIDWKNDRSAEMKWETTRKWYRNGYYEYVTTDYPEFFNNLNDNTFYLFEYGRALNKIGSYQKSDSLLSIGTTISSDPMFWNVMGNNSLALGRYREAEERYFHAFYMLPNRLYPLYLLAKLYYAEGDTTRFLGMADIINTFVPKVETMNTMDMRIEIKELRLSCVFEENKDDR